MKTSAALLIFLLTSCSAGWHLRKAISKDPSILIVKPVEVSIFRPEITVDSAANVHVAKPFVIIGEGITTTVTRFITNTPCDTLPMPIAVETTLAADSIKVAVNLPQVVYEEKENKYVGALIWIGIFVAFVYVAGKFVGRIRN